MIKTAFILNFFKLYNMLWKLMLPFLKKNKRLKPGFDKRISSRHHNKADIWIQAASAGEAYLAVQILNALVPAKKLDVLVTSITQQGLDILNTHLESSGVHNNINLSIEWFPFDMPEVMESCVKKINPKVMVLLETEIWPALLWHLKQNRVQIYIFNARLSLKSFPLYSKTKFLWKHLAPDKILATSFQDADRYKKIFKNSTVQTMPNIKFESMGGDEQDSATREKIKQILPDHLPVTLLASVRKQEEKKTLCILSYILSAYPNQIVAVFPRHMHRIKAWKKKLKRQKIEYCLRSELHAQPQNPIVILWDTFGELKDTYAFARVVFVGGSLESLGGQNFIEPATNGALTVTGPYYDDFAWVGDKIFKNGIINKKKNWESVAQFITLALKRQDFNGQGLRKKKACEYIRSHKGGILNACNELLKAFDG